METDYFKTWGTPWLYLMAYHGIVVFRQGKDCPSMYNVPFISSELMYWLKYIRCKLSMQQD